MNLDPNSSSKNSPIEYFNYLFTRNGLDLLRQEFVPTEDDKLFGNIYYNETTETITQYNQVLNSPNKFEEIKTTFSDFYLNRLYNEFLLSRKYIDNRIKELLDEHSIKLYLKLVIIDLYYLNAEIKRNEVLNKYKFSSKPINALLRFLNEKYPDFIPENLKGITGNVLNNYRDKEYEIEKGTPPPQTILLKTFKWLPNSKSEHLELLLIKLKDSKFIIDSTQLALFKNAFSGSTEMPQSKIQWMAKGKNKKTNKKLLIYLLNSLVSAGLIEKYKTNIIQFVFSDFNGTSFEYLPVSKSTAKNWKNIPPEYTKVDNIVNQLSTQAT